MKFKEFISSLLIVGNLLAMSSGYGVCRSEGIFGDVIVSEDSDPRKDDAPLDIPGGVSKCLGNVNEFFCNCGGKIGISNRKLSKALGWFGIGVSTEALINMIIRGVVSLLSKGDKTKGCDVVNITTHTTVALSKEGVKQNSSKPVDDSNSSYKGNISDAVTEVSIVNGNEKKK